MAAKETRPPDVVLVVADTLRSDRLSCYGYERETSPVIDSLAAQGVLFEDVTAQWPWTLPSMVSMFQGQYITDYRDELDPTAPNLVQQFRDAGYRTVGIVSNCLVDGDQGFDRGFDHFDCIPCFEDGEQKRPMRRDVRALRAAMVAQVEEALKLDDEGERQPLFLYLHANDPHSPYHAHPAFDSSLPLDGAADVRLSSWWTETLTERGPLPPQGRVDWAIELDALERERACYDQEVRYLDLGIGDILKDLRRLGLGEDAVHALVADHGEGLWEHVANDPPERHGTPSPRHFFYQLHGGNGYQPVMATPFLLWGGNLPRGLRVSAAVENVDLFPTLLELANIAPPGELDGRSLVPLTRGAPASWRDYVYCYGSHNIAIRDVASGLKLIVPSGKSLENGRECELYDLNLDPDERVNLASQRPEVVKDLVGAYARWVQANPTVSSLAGPAEVQRSEARKALAGMLRDLGYTEIETGLPSVSDSQPTR